MSMFRVTSDELNLRKGAGPGHELISALPFNTVVEKLESSPDGYWFRVRAGKDAAAIEGWVAARYLTPADASPVAGPSPGGWLESIGAFVVEKKEIPRPHNKSYFNNGHTMIGVLHTTESSTVKSAFVTLLANYSAPHFIAGEGRILQCRPINKQGAALKSTASYNPNTDAALQVEMVGFSQQKLWLPDKGSLDPVVAIMRWAAGDPLNIPLRRPTDEWLDDCSDCPPIWAKSANKRRETKHIWPKEKGWYMHMEVPLNDHWDCGALRMREMLALAAA